MNEEYKAVDGANINGETGLDLFYNKKGVTL